MMDLTHDDNCTVSWAMRTPWTLCPWLSTARAWFSCRQGKFPREAEVLEATGGLSQSGTASFLFCIQLAKG